MKHTSPTHSCEYNANGELYFKSDIAITSSGTKNSVSPIEHHSPDGSQHDDYAEIDIHNTDTSKPAIDKSENEYEHIQREFSAVGSKTETSKEGRCNIYDMAVLGVAYDAYDTMNTAKSDSRNIEANMYNHTIEDNPYSRTRIKRTSGTEHVCGHLT